MPPSPPARQPADRPPAGRPAPPDRGSRYRHAGSITPAPGGDARGAVQGAAGHGGTVPDVVVPDRTCGGRPVPGRGAPHLQTVGNPRRPGGSPRRIPGRNAHRALGTVADHHGTNGRVDPAPAGGRLTSTDGVVGTAGFDGGTVERSGCADAHGTPAARAVRLARVFGRARSTYGPARAFGRARAAGPATDVTGRPRLSRLSSLRRPRGSDLGSLRPPLRRHAPEGSPSPAPSPARRPGDAGLRWQRGDTDFRGYRGDNRASAGRSGRAATNT